MASCQENADTSEQGASRTVTNRRETPERSDSGSMDARKTAGIGRHSPRHLCRFAHTNYVGLNLCNRREVHCKQDDKVRYHNVNPLVHSHRCWDKRRLVLRVGGIHRGSRQANHPHHWWAAGDNVSLSEDISDIIERQWSRFSQHFPESQFLPRVVHLYCYTPCINFQAYRLCAGGR